MFFALAGVSGFDPPVSASPTPERRPPGLGHFEAEALSPVFGAAPVIVDLNAPGSLMSATMAEDTQAIVAYLERHGQKPLDPARYPEVNRPSGEAFRVACKQCHILPDPQRHTAQEWRAVVARMQENMEWMNRVVGSKPVPGEPTLRVEEINAFLARHARKP